MKKIRRYLLLAALLLLCVGGAIGFNIYRNREKKTYAAMQRASLPTMELSYEDKCQNLLFGYLDEMDLSQMRPNLLPVSERRKLSVTLHPYGNQMDQVVFQLRSIDGERLSDDGILDKWENIDGQMVRELMLTNLMEDGKEYMLIFLVRSGSRTIRYYSRVVCQENGNTDAMLDFVHEFSDATFRDGSDVIVNYIQPNDTMASDDLSLINIHSRYRMFVWNGLKPEIAGKVSTTVSELSGSQMTARLTYPVTVASESGSRRYEVEENYVVRFRNDTRYLLYYDRHMTERFNFASMQFDGGNIWLGMTDKPCSVSESPDGTKKAFVYEGQLWYYDSTENRMVSVFTYRDGEDIRASHSGHEIRVMRINNDASMDFAVAGYHNRGIHEGRSGVSFCRYNPAGHQIDELYYIPSRASEDRLMTQIGGLTYVSDSDILYFLYGDTVYSLDLAGGEKMELASREGKHSFYGNRTESVVAWQEGTRGQEEEIRVISLETGKLFTLTADSGEFLKILGFINDDLVYGIGRKADEGMLAGGSRILPHYRICFASVREALEDSGSYGQEGYYIADTQILDTRMLVNRLTKENGIYQPASQDQIFLNAENRETDTGFVSSRQEEGFLKARFIVLKLDPTGLSFQTKQCELPEKSLCPVFDSEVSGQESLYYAYSLGRLKGTFPDLSDAVAACYDEMGTVCGPEGNLLWSRETRALSKMLNLDEAVAAAEGETTLEHGAKTLLLYEKVPAADSLQISAGTDIGEALTEKYGGMVCDLTGCTISQILFYINRGHPVLAVTGGDSAVLICGYETASAAWYDFTAGTYISMPLAEAESYFGNLAARLYCCMPGDGI